MELTLPCVAFVAAIQIARCCRASGTISNSATRQVAYVRCHRRRRGVGSTAISLRPVLKISQPAPPQLHGIDLGPIEDAAKPMRAVKPKHHRNRAGLAMLVIIRLEISMRASEILTNSDSCQSRTPFVDEYMHGHASSISACRRKKPAAEPGRVYVPERPRGAGTRSLSAIRFWPRHYSGGG